MVTMEKSENRPYSQYHYAEVPTSPDATPIRPRRGRISRLAVALSFISLLTLGTVFFAIPNISFSFCHKMRGNLGALLTSPEGGETPVAASSNKVPLEAHIMSKCPDAQDCLQKLVVPVMERISEKVDFELSFIASVNNQSSDIHCKHGPGECIGDMLMLCAQDLPFSPEGESEKPTRMPTIRSLGFANCLIGQYKDIPDRVLVQNCALQHGIDFESLNSCVSRQEDDPNNGDLSGLALLRQSAIRSADLEVHTSCTVRLDDSVWCVRDDGEWKNCAKEGKGSQVPTLVEEIERLWEEKN
ncbi:hypothetical protein BDV26DRAFT_267481 [Aspergillus bertholletiae]|uniref:Gamma interferon inducible lysosomal thiol reductase-domain-containing protein n=1 Tax=Aspergillus bertholletiae TaxID=1226010 RepID=A0A5N7B361_9EURO|nr:hypothetical protein BDV26DRAFT_267481 [Aspergillus bertholletiae]